MMLLTKSFEFACEMRSALGMLRVRVLRKRSIVTVYIIEASFSAIESEPPDTDDSKSMDAVRLLGEVLHQKNLSDRRHRNLAGQILLRNKLNGRRLGLSV